MKKRGVRRNRSIRGRHATSRDLRSAWQRPVNGQNAGESPEGFAPKVWPEGWFVIRILQWTCRVVRASPSAFKSTSLEHGRQALAVVVAQALGPMVVGFP
jgi:hypothetical protein